MKLLYCECGATKSDDRRSQVSCRRCSSPALRLSTATADQLTAAAGLLARALARFPDNAPRDGCKFEVVGRLEVAGKAIGVELARRAFTPRTDERLQATE